MTNATASAHTPAPPRRRVRAAKHVSCWHEIPLYAEDGALHFVCEIPKETSAKMEVATVSGGPPAYHNGAAPLP